MTTLKEVMNNMIEEKAKIMVVDDDQEIREVISILLSNEEFCDERYGPGNYDKGPGSEYNKIKKWGDRGFE